MKHIISTIMSINEFENESKIFCSVQSGEAGEWNNQVIDTFSTRTELQFTRYNQENTLKNDIEREIIKDTMQIFMGKTFGSTHQCWRVSYTSPIITINYIVKKMNHSRISELNISSSFRKFLVQHFRQSKSENLSHFEYAGTVKLKNSNIKIPDF